MALLGVKTCQNKRICLEKSAKNKRIDTFIRDPRVGVRYGAELNDHWLMKAESYYSYRNNAQNDNRFITGSQPHAIISTKVSVTVSEIYSYGHGRRGCLVVMMLKIHALLFSLHLY